MYVLYGVLSIYNLYTVFVVSVVWPILHDGMCCVYCVLCVWCDDVCCVLGNYCVLLCPEVLALRLRASAGLQSASRLLLGQGSLPCLICCPL